MAVSNLVDKLLEQALESTRPDTVQRRIEELKTAIEQAQDRMSPSMVSYCNRRLAEAREHLNNLYQEERQRKAAAARIKQIEREHKEKEEQQRKAAVAQRKEIEYQEKQAAIEKKNNIPMTEHQKFILEQRRLMTPSLRYSIMERDGFRCKLCGATEADGAKLHVDHIFPVSKGGRTEPNNLRTLCDYCNIGKGAKIEKTV